MDAGQRADRAIDAAAQLLARADFKRGDILLMTDRVDDAATAAAVRARTQGYRVSVLGLGTPAGAAYRQDDGSIAQARLEPDTLRTLAAAGNGRYVALAAGDEDLRALGVLDPALEQTAGDAVGIGAAAIGAAGEVEYRRHGTCSFALDTGQTGIEPAGSPCI